MPAASLMAQSHVEIVERTPCLYEYRAWQFSFRRGERFTVPTEFTKEQCDLAAKVHERIAQQQAEAALVIDPSPGPRDADERSIACLHEYRLWRLHTKAAQSFDDGIASFAPFNAHGKDQCAIAKKEDERLAPIAAARAQREQLEVRRRNAEERRVEAEQKRRDAQAREQREAMARKPGVRIGMTAEEVIEKTRWGRPLRKNRTTTAAGVHEQWVYGGGNYLYFQDGRLTAIQN